MANYSSQVKKSKTPRCEDPHNPGHLDTHPLVREYFGEQLRSQRTEAWKECNQRLFNYYRALAPQLPESFREMEPLFLAVICGCKAIYIAKRCMKFTFRGSSGGMRPSLLRSSEPEGHCSRLWLISLNRDAGVRPRK